MLVSPIDSGMAAGGKPNKSRARGTAARSIDDQKEEQVEEPMAPIAARHGRGVTSIQC